MDFFLTSEIYDSNGDGNADGIRLYTYDDSGNLTSEIYDKDADNNAEETTTYTYDDSGNVTSEIYDKDADGNAESITTYSYDKSGNLTKHTREYKYAKKYEGQYEGEEEGEGEGKNIIIETYTYDDSGNQTSRSYDGDGDGNVDSIYTYTYDKSGNQTSYSYDRDADGNADSITSYTYDDSGNQTSKTSDTDADGNADSIYTYTYDDSGNQTSETYDSNADSNAELIRTYTYNKSGKRTSISYDGDGDGSAELIETYTYDDSGNQTSRSSDRNGDGSAELIETYAYDDSGNRISYTYDRNGDGNADSIYTYTYDDSSNLTTISYDNDADGNADSIYTYTYDDSGNQTSYSIDFNGDGNAESIYTYTYTKIESDNDGDVAVNSLDDKPNGTDDDLIAAGSGNNTLSEASGNDLQQQFLPTIRLEAETDYYWKNDAYNVQDIRDASGGNALSLTGGNTNETGAASYKFTGESGFYNLNLGTFDENDGVAKFAVLVNDEQIGSHAFMGSQLLSRNATVKSAVEKRMLSNYYLETGDIVQVRGFEDGDVEHARLDYIEFEPSKVETIRLEAETDFYDKSSSYWVQGIKHDIASNNRVLSLEGNGDNQTGYANYKFSGESGYYDLDLGTFDENDGIAKFKVAVNGEQIGETAWSNQEYFSQNPSWKTTVEHRMFSNFYLETGDIVQIQGAEDGGDAARLDYLDFTTVDDFAPETPVRIEAEDYLTYYDTTSGNQRNADYRSGDDVDIEHGGTNYVVTDVKEREWLSFDVEDIRGTRDVLLRVSSASRNVFKNIELEVDGKNYVSPNLGYTGGYDRYTDLIVNDVDFTGGGDLQLEFLSYGMKLDYIEIF